MDKAAFLDFVVEIVRRSEKASGFEVIPRRRVVERTLAWLSRSRRLARHYERLPETGEIIIHAAMSRIMLGRSVI
jgi:transposase